MNEPTIIINGVPLTVGQAMAVRVAVSTYLIDMAVPDALGDDEHGRVMAQAYRDRLTEVAKIMIGG